MAYLSGNRKCKTFEKPITELSICLTHFFNVLTNTLSSIEYCEPKLLISLTTKKRINTKTKIGTEEFKKN